MALMFHLPGHLTKDTAVAEKRQHPVVNHGALWGEQKASPHEPELFFLISKFISSLVHKVKLVAV